ncbi:MAG: hypothetical protein HQ582_29985 [Planctomycetes bacterium]|nr:hypothetical protein [Planctomycetota bacterium]
MIPRRTLVKQSAPGRRETTARTTLSGYVVNPAFGVLTLPSVNRMMLHDSRRPDLMERHRKHAAIVRDPEERVTVHAEFGAAVARIQAFRLLGC